MKLLLNRLANYFVKVLFHISLNDTTNAFKAYRKEVIDGCRPLIAPHFNSTVELPLKAIVRGNEPGGAWLLVAGLLYVAGTFLVTIIFDVPLNDALAAVNPESAGAVNVWRDYLTRWTIWNHVRTISALAATASLTVALCQLQRLLD